jgi:hypothetical protein
MCRPTNHHHTCGRISPLGFTPLYIAALIQLYPNSNSTSTKTAYPNFRPPLIDSRCTTDPLTYPVVYPDAAVAATGKMCDICVELERRRVEMGGGRLWIARQQEQDMRSGGRGGEECVGEERVDGLVDRPGK